MKYWPTILLCLMVWVTVIVARTDATNRLDFERGVAIVVVAIAWFAIGYFVHKGIDEDS